MLMSILRNITIALLCARAMAAFAATAVEALPQVREIFAQADSFGAFEGTPPAAPVYQGGRLIGYVFQTYDVLRIPAYSGKPINTLVGLDLQGRIAGLTIVHHEEPILAVGITQERLDQFTAQYKGKSAFDRIAIGAKREGYVAVDGISGATITVMVQNSTVMRSARQVAESLGIGGQGQVSASREERPATPEPAAESADAGAPPPRAGTPEDHPAPALAASADPSARPGEASSGAPATASKRDVSAPPKAPTPAQGRQTPRAAESNAALARPPAPAAAGERPWQAAPMLAPPSTAPPVSASIAAALAAAPGEEPVWVSVWQARAFEVAVLVLSLVVLSLILIFQDWLARHPTALIYVRHGFHVYTLFFLGWYALAQLSVVNVLTFAHSMFHDFRWENFLIDPMLFVLWSFVAVTLLLWGRGVYCGWLCPFGALQELTLEFSRRLKLRELEFPDVVHERLWAVKYIGLILLFGVSLQSLAEAAHYAEVEPFKTVITLRFQREWPFILYALALIGISFFNRKFFCKYLCPLGAALAIPGRFRLFDWWLRRRKECGKPCQVCYHRCSVRAIRPTGEINSNECHYCLDCQIIYYNDKMCLPLIERRKKREARLLRGKPAGPDRVIPIHAADSAEGSA